MWCEQLIHNLTFFPEKIESCCSGFQGPIYVHNPSNDVKIDWEDIKRQKMEFVKRLENNDIPKGCVGCPYLKEGSVPEEEDFRYKKIILNHYTHCNCRCVYCARLRYYTRDFTETPRKPDFYHILPILKQIYSLGEKEVDIARMKVDFQGGDLSVLDEFEDTLKFLLDNGCKDIEFTTNNLRYQPLIERCLAEKRGYMITSLDCGCRETYKKVKRVDKFDIFVENLSRYLAAIEEKFRILVPYIVVRNINDNLEEVEKYLNLINELGVKRIRFEIDYNDLLGNKGRFEVPKHYYDIFNLFEKFTEENKIMFLYQPYTKEIMDRGFCG